MSLLFSVHRTCVSETFALIAPAQSLEQVVIRLRSDLDASQNAHRRLGINVLRELDLVEIFRSYPTEYGSAQKSHRTETFTFLGRIAVLRT